MTAMIRIAVPPEQVFERIADLSRHEAFTDHFLIDWRDTGPDHVNVRAKMPDPRTERTSTSSSAIRRAASSSSWWRPRASGGRSAPGRSSPTARTARQVTFATEQQATPAIERVVAPLTRRWIQRGNEKSLERLREQAEGRAGA